MAKNESAFFLSGFAAPTYSKIENSNSTNRVEICAAGANDSYVYDIYASSNDVANTLTIEYYDGANYIPLQSLVDIAVNQGTSTQTKNPLNFIQKNAGALVMRLLDRDQNYFLPLKSGHKLYAKVGTAVTNTAGKKIDFLVLRQDF